MASDFEIGRVVAVDTSQVTIELNNDLKALTRSTYERTIEVGRINSYVIIPVGVQRIVAMITKVVMTEEAEIKTDKTMVTLPSARRLMKATMIGTIDGDDFKQGISLFPVLDSPVLVASQKDLQAIFGMKNDNNFIEENPGYCISIGKSVIFPEYDICINPDSFFGKHAAVIGSTGSGKSCTIATIIQSVLESNNVKGTHIIILDTNGEYRNAFQNQINESVWKDARPEFRTLYIPTDPGRPSEQLCIPYWFMNADEFVRIFRAAPQIQRPVLLDALRMARMPNAPCGEKVLARDIILQELHRILGLVSRATGVSIDIRILSNGLIDSLKNDSSIQSGIPKRLVNKLIEDLEDIARKVENYIQNNYPRAIPLPVRRNIESKLIPFIQELTSITSTDPEIPMISADSPLYFPKDRFVNVDLENAMHGDEAGAARARENCATMLMRIDRLLNDRRYEFLFGSVGRELPSPLHALATFLRDIFGLTPRSKEFSPENEVKKGLFPFYDRQREAFNECYKVVIIDLSLLTLEVLENVTALIGRLILEFLQRAGDKKLSGIERGSFPVVMVLEEAQNYIRETHNRDDESISREVFERIAREGRKYGLGLIIASQRPSELSKTILSQCNSFIVHRLQNPEDLNYFREIVPGVYKQLLDQLPALAPQHALVLGECVRAPALVYMREACPVPKSKDPKFYKEWVAGKPSIPNVEKVCEVWEKGVAEAAPTRSTDRNFVSQKRESAAAKERNGS